MGHDTHEDDHIKNGEYMFVSHHLNLFLKEICKENKKPNKI